MTRVLRFNGSLLFVASRIEEPLRLASLPRLRCELVPHQVELMRHGQIKALPRESVTPVGLLTEETRVFRPCWFSRHPRARNDSSKGSRTDKRTCSHHLKRPRIVFGMIRTSPQVQSSRRHLRPA